MTEVAPLLTIEERSRGMLVGLACGDAVGASVEFKQRGSFPNVTSMQGGGKFRLKPGEWTDDTSMALCLADSLIACNGFNPVDQMGRYKRWIDTGYRSCRPHPIGIGKTVLQSLMKFQRSGDHFAGSKDPKTAGNGALMRLAPIPLFFYPDLDQTCHWAKESTRTTHGAEECLAASELLAELLHHALRGKLDSRDMNLVQARDYWPDSIRALAKGSYLQKTYGEIRGSGYVVESLEAALWCFWKSKNFEDAILLSVNLGDDADTTAAICGQIAGACYGHNSIPAAWRSLLVKHDEISDIADTLISKNKIA